MHRAGRGGLERKSLTTSYAQLQSVEDAWSEGTMILMYHSVGVPPLFYGYKGLHVTPQLLVRQIEELQPQVGFSTLGEWSRKPSTRQVVLTFDDAYENLFRNGLPVLQKAGVRAITYVVSSLVGKSNEWDRAKPIRRERLMDKAQLVEWMEAGHEVGAHTVTHPHLTSLSPEEARREIFDSKKELEDMFGCPIRHFCYPYGDCNEQVSEIVREAGYETATSCIPGFNVAGTDTFMLRRFMATHERPWLTSLLGQ